MSDLKVLNLYGGPCSGKSTCASGLFYYMKMNGYKVELVTEYPKDLVYDGILDVMLDRQEVIFAEQNQRIHRLRNNVDYAIVDSPILLSLVYPEINQRIHGVNKWDAMDAFQAFVLEVYKTYNNYNFFLERPNVFQEWGRNHTLEEAKSIDDAIMSVLLDNNIPVTTVFSAKNNTVDDILTEVLGKGWGGK